MAMARGGLNEGLRLPPHWNPGESADGKHRRTHATDRIRGPMNRRVCWGRQRFFTDGFGGPAGGLGCGVCWCRCSMRHTSLWLLYSFFSSIASLYNGVCNVYSASNGIALEAPLTIGLWRREKPDRAYLLSPAKPISASAQLDGGVTLRRRAGQLLR